MCLFRPLKQPNIVSLRPLKLKKDSTTFKAPVNVNKGLFKDPDTATVYIGSKVFKDLYGKGLAQDEEWNGCNKIHKLKCI